MGADISALLGIANLGMSAIPMGVSLYDRMRLMRDPFIQGGVANAAQQANAIQGSNLFDPMMQAYQTALGADPSAGLMQGYSQLLQQPSPQLQDSASGMAALMGRQTGFTGQTSPTVNPNWQSMSVGNVGTPSLNMPTTQFPTDPSVPGGDGLPQFIQNMFGGGGGGVPPTGGGTTPPTGTGNVKPTTGGVQPPWNAAAKSGTAQATGTTPGIQNAVTAAQNAPQQTQSAQPNLYGQLLANPTSMNQGVQDAIYRQGAQTMGAGQQDLLRRMRDEGNAAGTLGTGRMQDMMWNANESAIQNRGDLRANIGIDAAKTNWGNLLQSAQTQLGAEQAYANQIMQQNALQQNAYNQNFTNQARILQDAYGAQNQEQQRQLGLVQNMTNVPLQQMGLTNDLIDRLIRMRTGQISPSPASQIPTQSPYWGAGGSGGGGGGSDLAGALGGLAGYGLGQFGSF